MKTRFRTDRYMPHLILAATVVLALACKKSPAPDSAADHLSPIPSAMSADAREDAEIATRIAKINADPKLDAAGKKLLASVVPEEVAADFQEIKDRNELVLPPPPDWKPENVDRKIKLTLIPEKTRIPVMGTFRYRLEVQNVGREPILFLDDGAGFIKTGKIGSDILFGFQAATPGGKEEKVPGPYVLGGTGRSLHEYVFPGSMTAEEKDRAFERIRVHKHAEHSVQITLQSGETMFTRPSPPRPNRYRDLLTRNNFFAKPGSYRIKAIYNHPLPSRPTEKVIAAKEQLGLTREDQEKNFEELKHEKLGLVESNTIILEVVK